MDALEPISGNGLAQVVLGKGANTSYYFYEDLPTNAFSASEDTDNDNYVWQEFVRNNFAKIMERVVVRLERRLYS